MVSNWIKENKTFLVLLFVLFAILADQSKKRQLEILQRIEHNQDQLLNSVRDNERRIKELETYLNNLSSNQFNGS